MNRILPLVLLSAALLARPAAAQTRRSTSGLQLWPEAQAELALPGNDYLLLSARGQQNTDNNHLLGGDPKRVLGFDEQRLNLAYEHFFGEHWSLGGTLGYFSASTKDYVLIPEVLLRHRSPVGPLTFGQRLSVERTFPSVTGAKGQTNARLRVDLEKLLPLGTGSFALRPRLSYEATTHVRLLTSDTDPDERTIQFTSLRGEVGVRVAGLFDFTPWFAYQTNYSFSLASYDRFNNIIIPAGRLNAVTPVLGLDLRFTILQGQGAEGRQQLPTQH
ncbi:hypothetical protein [Hymenobacter negativus]|uniref:PorT family protein n=1 Tax=Hymenobacter negativus TaxID=2795026 RepID=A0ABS0Q9Z7_9BACT|nr:hypothetical protein [Hymenobacter negativus]MBH8559507.1 hypothetical protein [Hymenobacter negativus]